MTKEQKRIREKFEYNNLGELGIDDSEATGPLLIDPDELPDDDDEEEEADEEEEERTEEFEEEPEEEPEEEDEPKVIFDRAFEFHIHRGTKTRTERLRITIDTGEFKESEHPRNKIGEFAAKGSGGGGASGGASSAKEQAEAVFSNIEKYLTALGMKYVGTPDQSYYHKFVNKLDPKKKLLITQTPGEGPEKIKWVASAEGHLTKKGTGLASLQILYSGGKPPPSQAWENVGGYAPAFSSPTPQVSSPTPPHAIVYQTLKKNAGKPNPAQTAALSHYTGSGHSIINNCLRYMDNCNDERVAPLESYLNENRLHEPLTVYRGVGGEYAKILASIATVGTKFVDRGFLSTSTRSDLGFGNLNLKITAPAGTKAAAISQFGTHSNEYEVLFQRNSALVVKKYVKETNTLEVEILQEGDHQVALPAPSAVGVGVGGGPGPVGTAIGTAPSAVAPSAPPKAPKIKKVKPDDPYPSMSFEELMDLATSKGYVEKKPDIQPKVRRMRVIIYLRKLDKAKG